MALARPCGIRSAILALTLTLAVISWSAPQAAADPGPLQQGRSGERSGMAAASRPALPGRFVIRGAPLARSGRSVAGGAISVHARPAAVVVEGCRTRSRRLRVGRSRATVAATATCGGIRGRLTLSGTITGKTLRGSARHGRRTRRFVARLRSPRGVMLAGRPSARALRAVKNTTNFARHSPSQVSKLRGGSEVARTEIELRFERKATVGQVNGALRAVGGRIAGSIAGSPLVAVASPDPGSAAALAAILKRLERMRGVARAAFSDMVAAEELPPAFASPLSGTGAARLSHLLALRMPAAWNARGALQLAERPTVIVPDFYGNGRLSSHVDATYNRGALRRLTEVNAAGRRVPLRDTHGYHVVGTLAATFANDGTAPGAVTGVFPATTRLVVIDVLASTTLAANLELRDAARRTAGRLVANTSLGYKNAPSEARVRIDGADWAELVRQADLEKRMFHATAAGNESGEAARVGSRWTASLRGDLRADDDTVVPPLQNTMVVENLVDTGAPAFAPGCLADSSNRGGTAAVVGTDVFSHLFTPQAGDLTGTSMASPQVAGLAAYIWSIAPDLEAPELRALLMATAAPPLATGAGGCGSPVPSAPRLDAYGAVLSLDGSRALTPAGARVRHAIMDHDGNGTVDSQDLAAFAAARRADSFDRDWSRSDLNGDGFTGGDANRAPLDLDPAGSPRGGAPQLGVVELTIDGARVRYDERSVSDKEALCFWAYSGLYQGSPSARSSTLSPQDCGAVRGRTGSIVINSRGGLVGAAAGCGEQRNGQTDDTSPPFGTEPIEWNDSKSFDCPAGSEGSAHGDATHNASLRIDGTTGVVTVLGSGQGNGSCTDPGGPGGGNGCVGRGERAFEVRFTVTGSIAYTLSGNGSAGAAALLRTGAGAPIEEHSGPFALSRAGFLTAGEYVFEEETRALAQVPISISPVGPRSDADSANSDVTLRLEP